VDSKWATSEEMFVELLTGLFRRVDMLILSAVVFVFWAICVCYILWQSTV